MKKWEYKIRHESRINSHTEMTEKIMAELGENGWELVTIRQGRFGWDFYFKRELYPYHV